MKNLDHIEIQFSDGSEITEEIRSLLRSYDFYSCYIDDYTQYKNAERRNLEIEIRLNELGVKQFRLKKDETAN